MHDVLGPTFFSLPVLAPVNQFQVCAFYESGVSGWQTCDTYKFSQLQLVKK
jgi:hypothetical protein